MLAAERDQAAGVLGRAHSLQQHHQVAQQERVALGGGESRPLNIPMLLLYVCMYDLYVQVCCFTYGT